jgi:hypothetical protein
MPFGLRRAHAYAVPRLLHLTSLCGVGVIRCFGSGLGEGIGLVASVEVRHSLAMARVHAPVHGQLVPLHAVFCSRASLW